MGRSGVTPVGARTRAEFKSDLLGGEKTVELITKNYPGVPVIICANGYLPKDHPQKNSTGSVSPDTQTSLAQRVTDMAAKKIGNPL